MNRTYASLFIEIGKYAFITGAVITALVTSAALASSQGLKAPPQGPLKAVSAQLAIKSPNVNVCPATATMAGWIHTSKPGQVSYMIAKKGGSVSGPFTLQAVKAVNGGMASFSKSFQIHNAINTEYRILVSGSNGKVMSNWVPLTASCKIKLGG
ncbi:hypothetical protein [Salaquimonas pukyongi]|uniref:hypothetical protein n=1 Tax=Salaquimonas pukyongi TaxID=2712698 RepID=UPI00096B6F69|nr:hypothetical protein [Salaquimonas pukyongi]